MSKLFGEYLVENSLITEEQLLDALIEQVEEQNSVVKITRDLKLMNSGEILHVLKQQVINQKSFLDTAKELSFWDQNKTDKVLNSIAAQRIPLGEILVKKKILDVGKLTSALDEYFGEKIKNSEAKQSEKKTEFVVKPAPPSANSKLPQNESLYPEIFEFLGPNFIELLKCSLLEITAGTIKNRQLWGELCDEIHKIQGAANLYDFSEMAEFYEKFENILRVILSKKSSDIPNEVIKKISNTLVDANSVIEFSLLEYQNQRLKADFFSMGNQAQLIKSIYDSFARIEFEVSHISNEKGA